MSIIKSAEESRIEYASKKTSIVNLLNRTIEFYENNEDDDKAKVFRKLSEDLINGEFSIVVVGEFSAGKSTLLNALMRKRILPSFSNETTATVNFLRHKDLADNDKVGTVYYCDGRTQDIFDASVETINEYVSTKGNEVAKNVEHLDLYLDSDFLKDGVTLVDSPGLNGIADGHREITEQQILKSHASIFVFNSDHPGSKTDFEFLHDLQKKVKSIIFVLNKIDGIKEDEGETVESIIESLKSNYKKQFPEETSVPEIWPVAAFPALVARSSENISYHDKAERTETEKKALEEQSRLVPFENRLISFLTCGEKTKQQLLSPVERVIVVTSETRDIYKKDKLVLESAQDSDELENQRASIEESINSLEKQLIESRIQIKKNVNTSFKEVVEELSSQIAKLADRKLNEIEKFDDLEELNDYLHNFEDSFVRRVKSISLEGEENLQSRIKEVIRINFTNQADLIEQHISEEENSINIEINKHLEIEEHFFQVGIKEMDEKTKKMEDELKHLKEEAALAEKDYIKARNNEKKRNEIETKIKYLQESKDTIAAQILPSITQRTVSVPDKEARGGLLGITVDLLFGLKSVTRQKLVEDTRERDEAKSRMDAQLKEKQQEIDKSNLKLEQFEDIDPIMMERIQISKAAEVNEALEKLSRHQKENIEKINESHRKEIRRRKRNLSNFCDEISEELIRQVKKELKASEERYVLAISEIIEANIKNDLATKQARLQRLIQQSQESEENKKERIALLDEKIDLIEQIISSAVDLSEELKNSEIDLIKKIEI